MQYLSGFLSASSSAAPLSAQQKCPLLNPECSEKYLKKFFLVNSPMILCYFGLVEEFDPTASPSMSVLRQYRLGPVLACSQLLEPSFSIRVEHPKIQSSFWGGHRQGKKKSAICRLFRAPYFFVGSLSPFCRLLSPFCRFFYNEKSKLNFEKRY